MKLEVFIKFLLFGCCLLIAWKLFKFEAQWVAILLGCYQFCSSMFELYTRKEILTGNEKGIKQLKLENANNISAEKKIRVSFNKKIIKDNNRTINKLVTLINSTFSDLNIPQQKNLLESLESEIDQQINYTKNLCDQYLSEIEAKKCIKPLNDFKWSIMKQIQGKKARKGIKFDKLLTELQNLEDKLNV